MASSPNAQDWLVARRRYLLALIDAFLVAMALALAYFIQSLDTERWELVFAEQYKALVPYVVAAQILLFAVSHLYRGMLRYAGLTELRIICVAATIVFGGLIVFNLCSTHIPDLGQYWPRDAEAGHVRRIPYGVVVSNWMMSILLVGGFRLSRRVILGALRRKSGRNVIIVGVEAGEAAAREMLQRPTDEYEPIGFISSKAEHIGRRVHGLKVLGGTDDLAKVIREYAIEEVIIALPEAGGGLIRRLNDICREESAQAKILPTVTNVMSGQVSVSAIRPVTIEDILGREPVTLDLSGKLNYISGKRVLITGAGGSIGSEIVRQILPLEPAQIILLGRGENSLFEFAAELGIQCPDERFPQVIANVCDSPKMRSVFERWRPEVVFHAAAHKHVPLMETNPEEAIKNNVFGTRVVAELASEYAAERFILISTDKAVKPTSVMGASKRLTELVAWDIAARSQTLFAAVRFGNVLGSRGSVIPTLRRQIADGGPVTITHRDMTRYFMTISEAASLVVQSGALACPDASGGDATRGRLFVLDMGEPVKIIDLIHNLVSLSGFRPGHDIEIRETGLRPGEKIVEELLTTDESLKATRFGKVFITETEAFDSAQLGEALDRLEQAANSAEPETIRNAIALLIPDYTPDPVD